MSDYNPRGFISSSSFRTCVVVFVAAALAYGGAFIVGFIVGRVTG